MKTVLLLVILTLCQVKATHYLFGTTSNGELAHTENVIYNAIPFIKRVKHYFYTQPDNRKIVAIQALDSLHSTASINVTAGGIGYPFVNLRLKSDRGSGLDYSIGIYVEPHRF